MAIINSSGFPSRGPDGGPSVQALKAETAKFEASPCLERGGLIPKTGECLLGSGNIAPTIVLWGDSQAAHLAPSLSEAARTTGVRVRQITKAGCAPFPNMTMLPASPFTADCPAFNSSALQSVLADRNVTLVILAGRWNTYSGRGGSFLSKDGSWPSQEASKANFTSAIKETAAPLATRGIKTAVVGPAPEPPTDVPTCLIRADFMNGDAPCSTMPAERSWQNNQILADLLPRTVQFVPIVPSSVWA